MCPGVCVCVSQGMCVCGLKRRVGRQIEIHFCTRSLPSRHKTGFGTERRERDRGKGRERERGKRRERGGRGRREREREREQEIALFDVCHLRLGGSDRERGGSEGLTGSYFFNLLFGFLQTFNVQTEILQKLFFSTLFVFLLLTLHE